MIYLRRFNESLNKNKNYVNIIEDCFTEFSDKFSFRCEFQSGCIINDESFLPERLVKDVDEMTLNTLKKDKGIKLSMYPIHMIDGGSGLSEMKFKPEYLSEIKTISSRINKISNGKLSLLEREILRLEHAKTFYGLDLCFIIN